MASTDVAVSPSGDGMDLTAGRSPCHEAEGILIYLAVPDPPLRTTTTTTVYRRKLELQVEHSRNAGSSSPETTAKGREYLSGDLGGDRKKLVNDGEVVCMSDGDGTVHLLISKPARFRSELLSVTDDSNEEEETLTLTVAPTRPLVEAVVVNPEAGLSPAAVAMIRAASAGLEKGHVPMLSPEGTGGAYFMRGESGEEPVAVFKPVDEEPMAENNPRGLPLSPDGEGLKRGTRVGEGSLREVAAYILDYPISGSRRRGVDEPGFAGVPLTVLARCLHRSGDHAGEEDGRRAEEGFKIGSLQMFVKNSGSCEDLGPRAFPTQEVHKVAVLDMRLANADRHAGNLLFHTDGDGHNVLIPIDHGYCLPENFQDCTFEWLSWPQAREPFSSETLSYISSLDAEEDIKLLKFHGWELPLECARVLRISTMLLKKGAERCMTPFDIGRMMCRETIRSRSLVEYFIEEASANVVLHSGTGDEEAFMEAISEIMDRHLDELSS